jgi:hypothetical protein
MGFLACDMQKLQRNRFDKIMPRAACRKTHESVSKVTVYTQFSTFPLGFSPGFRLRFGRPPLTH